MKKKSIKKKANTIQKERKMHPVARKIFKFLGFILAALLISLCVLFYIDSIILEKVIG